MTYNGKMVWTEDDFSYSSVQIGDYVEQAVVDNAMDCMPPACMRSDCSQMGEPYGHLFDPNTGALKAAFATFKKVEKGIWMFCGYCFRGENIARGITPPYVKG